MEKLPKHQLEIFIVPKTHQLHQSQKYYVSCMLHSACPSFNTYEPEAMHYKLIVKVRNKGEGARKRMFDGKKNIYKSDSLGPTCNCATHQLRHLGQST
jgi:hypothetical protein